jgi:uncharacterized LabA/DUF88 family protein
MTEEQGPPLEAPELTARFVDVAMRRQKERILEQRSSRDDREGSLSMDYSRSQQMGNYVYVDNSNVWIEGMHVSAVRRGMAPDVFTAQTERIVDTSWRIDFGKLYEFAGGNGSDVARAALFGSRPPPNDTLWAVAKAKGFEVIVFDRNVKNQEKKVDVAIVSEILVDCYQKMSPGKDEVTLVAGDGDYVPAVEKVIERGISFNVMFWAHASRELREASTKFFPMDDYLDHLKR